MPGLKSTTNIDVYYRYATAKIVAHVRRPTKAWVQ